MTNAATCATHEHVPDLPIPPAALLDGASLFLDFDGTLVEIASRPDAVAVDLRLRTLIASLSDRLAGRVAVVSGRPVASIRTLMGEGVAIGGSHGLEMRWPDGTQRVPIRPEGLDMALATMRAFADSQEGVLVEEKPFGAGLHYREASAAAEDACRALAERLAADTGMIVQSGKKVFELRPGGADKGAAIAAFLETPPFAGHRPVFIGDDVTDEDGFAMAARHGGVGILVGPNRRSHARHRLPCVSETLAWLENFAGSTR